MYAFVGFIASALAILGVLVAAGVFK
jgi:hypothetical protein